MTRSEYEALAMENVNSHLGDACTADDDIETIQEEVRMLVGDALADANCPEVLAAEIISSIVAQFG